MVIVKITTSPSKTTLHRMRSPRIAIANRAPWGIRYENRPAAARKAVCPRRPPTSSRGGGAQRSKVGQGCGIRAATAECVLITTRS